MRFPYRLETSPRPVFALGGRWVRPRPVLLVTVIGPSATIARNALLDTGADDTIFPEAWAATLGLDLTQAPVGEAAGIGRAGFPVRYAEVQLRITDGKEFRDWPARVGFTSAALKRPLLGFAGFLQFFTATFRGDREEVELEINPLYPGT
jgi:hypothetical protein